MEILSDVSDGINFHDNMGYKLYSIHVWCYKRSNNPEMYFPVKFMIPMYLTLTKQLFTLTIYFIIYLLYVFIMLFKNIL